MPSSELGAPQTLGYEANVRPPCHDVPTYNERKSMSKTVVFSLTKPKSELPFTTLKVSLKKFKQLRLNFEELGLRVEVEDFQK